MATIIPEADLPIAVAAETTSFNLKTE